ncbi:MAG: hypothetical protein LBM26_00850 [Methanobrevibacter sp.]|jgi:hypothetical protein|nr:hypothetical protein [Methanobrevibacter sp.]
MKSADKIKIKINKKNKNKGNENKKNKKDKIKEINNIIKNQNGYVFTGLTAIMIVSFMIIAILMLNVVIELNKNSSDSIDSNSFNYLIEDYNKNIAILGRTTIEKITNETINSYTPAYDASDMIEKELEEKLNEVNEELMENQAINIETDVLSVYNGEDPYHINVKTLVIAKKGNFSYNNVVESKIAIDGLKDPLPFLMCRNNPTLTENGTKIAYGNSLKSYLDDCGLDNADGYLNASSPLIIKKCPYDPYENHGYGHTMKNCIDNSYYHESADGSCYLCRLEGKCGCGHYGLETFIIPNKIAIEDYNNGNFKDKGISASDHVIFNEQYPGNSLVFYKNNGFYEFLFLDDSHRAKYGLSDLSVV